jgi:hypothetical protein
MNSYFHRSITGTVELIREQLDQVEGEEVKVCPPPGNRSFDALLTDYC